MDCDYDAHSIIDDLQSNSIIILTQTLKDNEVV